jgi:hypothetical protein
MGNTLDQVAGGVLLRSLRRIHTWSGIRVVPFAPIHEDGERPSRNADTIQASNAPCRRCAHASTSRRAAIKRFQEDAAGIEARWREVLRLANASPSPNYPFCYPDDLIGFMVTAARQGVAEMQCRMAAPGTADPIHLLLNEAWTKFWSNPARKVRLLSYAHRATVTNQRAPSLTFRLPYPEGSTLTLRFCESLARLRTPERGPLRP